MTLPLIRKLLPRQINRSAQDTAGSRDATIEQRPRAASSAKALPKLPPTSTLDYLDAADDATARNVPVKQNYSAAFLRRLDVASARASSPHRTVPPLAIILAFERSSVHLKGDHGLQAELSDSEIDARARAAYDASLPRPRRVDNLASPVSSAASSKAPSNVFSQTSSGTFSQASSAAFSQVSAKAPPGVSQKCLAPPLDGSFF